MKIQEVDSDLERSNLADAFYNTYRIIMMDAPGVRPEDILVGATIFYSRLVVNIAENNGMTDGDWEQVIERTPKALSESLKLAYRNMRSTEGVVP